MAEKDDLEFQRMYAAIGRAISQWAYVEAVLADIYGSCISAKNEDEESAVRSFAVLSADPKIKSLHKEMNSRFSDDPDILKRWLELRKPIRDAKEIRNMIAHGTVAYGEVDLFLYPYAPSWMAGAGEKRERPLDFTDPDKMAVETVEEAAKTFSNLVEDCSALGMAIEFKSADLKLE